MLRDTSSSDSTKKVLVVDDDPTIGDLIAMALTFEGFDPVLVRDGEQALRAARSLRPDAITLDLEMPGRDGRSILRSLQADDETRQVPVVVVSANCHSLSTQEEGLVARTVPKPFELPALVEAVGSVVGRA